MKPLQVLLFALLASPALPLAAAVHTLDAPSSPIKVDFDSASGRLKITTKSDGWIWKNPDNGGGSNLAIGTVVQSADNLQLTANAMSGTAALVLTFELRPALGELVVGISGANAAIGGGLVYPYPFFPADGSGHAVVPVDSGYVVPTTETAFSPPAGQRGMEWFGGTDAANGRGWVALVDTPDDYELKVRTGALVPAAGPAVTRLGTCPNWRGSNNNAARNGQLLSYDRKLRYRFFSAGGYVALAKEFRASAFERGWLKTLRQKQQENPVLALDRFIGAPVCYLWGDGRSTALLDAMKTAGIDKALIQVSANHVDQQRNFPATGLADAAWFDAVRARGYLGGFYDIYAASRVGGQGGSPYDGFYYLWPQPAASTDWVYVLPNGQLDSRRTISSQKGAEFAQGTRLPAHVSRFDLDAYFFDVVCAVDLIEDYDTLHGHFATRTIDRTNRTSLLSSAYSLAGLLTGTEQGRSWAVPVLHWAEGKSWIGSVNPGLSDGTFNDNAYPAIMVDAVDPTNNAGANRLGALLSDGFQVPLWDLVFHDSLVTTVHWHRPHNKYLYAWDHADRVAMLRGQAPLLNITYEGVQGLASRQPNTLQDNAGNNWSSRWSVSAGRFVRTYDEVCRWHEQIGWMEMIDHRRLREDRSVQMSEFSEDGGLNGHGIVVNFGLYDGAYGVGAGAAWSGIIRGQNITVAPGSFQTYSWTALAIATTTLPDANSNEAYAQTLLASGGVPPVTWSIIQGTLPAGLVLDGATGVIAGMNPAVGVYEFTVQAVDSAGGTATKSLALTVHDTTPPVIVSLESSLDHLWPANHKMVAVEITAAASDNVGIAALHIVAVTSNEPENEAGDGNTSPDWEITDGLTLNLRAERSGAGAGRLYTIIVEATDLTGNAAYGTVTVSVPKNQSGK